MWSVNKETSTKCLMIILSLLFVNTSDAAAGGGIKCYIGYGQEGREYKYGVEWPRDCPLSKFCFKAVTSDIQIARTLFDFTWDSYYDTYYVKGCLGDYGTTLDTALLPPGNSKGTPNINITTPLLVTGQGGTREFYLLYTCGKSLCSSTVKQYKLNFMAITAPVLLTILLYILSSS